MKLTKSIYSDIANFLSSRRENTERRYAYALEHYQEWGGDFEPRNAGAYLGYMIRAGYAPSTIKANYHALSSICEYLTAIGSMKSNPFKSAMRIMSFRQKRQVRPTATIDPALIIPTIEAIPLDLKGVRDRAMLAILFGCGLRRSELAALKMGDVKLSRQKSLYLDIKNTKGGEDRKQPVPAWVNEFIAEKIASRRKAGAGENDPVFQSTYGDRSGLSISTETIYRAFKARFDGAPHSARSAFATRLLEQGFDYERVADALGHADSQHVRDYDHRERSLETNVGGLITY